MSSNLEFKGYALTDASKWSDLNLTDFKPKTFQPDDVEISITHCGVCGSDVHTLTQGWGESKLPLVVGHEIVGKVTRVGKNVVGIKQGDRVGVGAQIGSCMECRACKASYENYCPHGIPTYNGQYPDGIVSQGGYGTAIRAHQQFVFPIPDEIESRDAASMMCGGLTVFSPLKTHGAGPGKKVGVVGIGGLGHYAVLWAKAMGAEVYAFTHDQSKMEDIKKMGADHIINTEDKDWHKPLALTLDLIVSTRDVFAPDTPLGAYLSMLFVHGKFITVGIPDADQPLPAIHSFDVVPNGCMLGGSAIGSKKECMEMLELAKRKGIKPWIHELPMKEAKKALEDVKANRVRYRYVLTQDIQAE
ncbi:GroES-like protein [Laetiporus sulphureus 93-53]|uniref:alcohol dehydrogenase (NADP(+)) n=1 Tax=Laetiporus sulphureus 93-53 TaxID=1314785 RepID=A0A165GXN2_9APHY|nr:GroES-like protein [Laetiporus sulphureus 93-53]KZT10968.1 GroES-like protein [Laetiporus sulphureus 93-53]